MSVLPGNPHSAKAETHGVLLGDIFEDEGLTDATITGEALLVNAQATLALAFEQRTANLIAVAAHGDQMGKTGDAYWEEIAERLGLGDTK